MSSLQLSNKSKNAEHRENKDKFKNDNDAVLTEHPSWHMILKAATHDKHQLLHRCYPFVDIFRGNISKHVVNDYVCINVLIWQYIEKLSKTEKAETILGTQLSYLFNTAALARCSDSFEQQSKLREPVIIKKLEHIKDTEINVWAGIYLFLGSKKGGEILAKKLSKSGFTELAALIVYQAQERALWQQLCDHFATFDAQTLKQLCDSVNQLFDAFSVLHLTEGDCR